MQLPVTYCHKRTSLPVHIEESSAGSLLLFLVIRCSQLQTKCSVIYRDKCVTAANLPLVIYVEMPRKVNSR